MGSRESRIATRLAGHTHQTNNKWTPPVCGVALSRYTFSVLNTPHLCPKTPKEFQPFFRSSLQAAAAAAAAAADGRMRGNSHASAGTYCLKWLIRHSTHELHIKMSKHLVVCVTGAAGQISYRCTPSAWFSPVTHGHFQSSPPHCQWSHVRRRH